MLMSATGQIALCRDRIPDSAKRILWINQTAPSLGDALMDTAGRSLLQDREVTLLTSDKNIRLFEHDAVFQRVTSCWRDCKEWSKIDRYDLVILDSFSPKSLKFKFLIAPSAPLVGLFGFLNAFEVHRSIYSYRRMEKLLGISPTSVVRLSHGIKPKVSSARFEPPVIAIGVGGEWRFRTYPYWAEVLCQLLASGYKIVLLGSQNGVGEGLDLKRRFPAIIDLVGKTNFSELVSILGQTTIYIGADGGLWHLASACGVPSIALHADCQLFNEEGVRVSRAPQQPICHDLHGHQDVSEIDPSVVVKAALDLLAKLKN